MRLSQLVDGAVEADPAIAGVTADSRRVRPGWLFAAMPGSKVDGRSFIPAALAAGAAAVLAPEDVTGLPVPVAHARDIRRAYALAASRLWGEQPATVVAITGTNGKTSIAALCRQIFARLGHASASMGTLGFRISYPDGHDEVLTPPGLTTPDAADIAELLARAVTKGVTHLAMEASSHGIDQRRLDGVRLTAAGLTNFTQDHLDYHGTMGAYRAAKLRLFDTLLPTGGVAVLNADSDAFEKFDETAREAGQTVLSVGEHGGGLRLIARRATPEGQQLTVAWRGKHIQVRLPLAGAFQASNALVAAGLCIAAGEAAEAALAALEHVKGAPGRLQRIGTGRSGGEAYVDYAHTPDGLETVLSALRPHTDGRLIVVFGAGGDRDKGKRPQMGEIAERLADIAIVTDDNPRSEEPAAIRADILKAAPHAREIGDRRAAIRAAVAELRAGDVLVVAGKGHEQGQVVGATTHPFDDVTEVGQALELAHV